MCQYPSSLNSSAAGASSASGATTISYSVGRAAPNSGDAKLALVSFSAVRGTKMGEAPRQGRNRREEAVGPCFATSSGAVQAHEIDRSSFSLGECAYLSRTFHTSTAHPTGEKRPGARKRKTVSP